MFDSPRVERIYDRPILPRFSGRLFRNGGVAPVGGLDPGASWRPDLRPFCTRALPAL